MAISKLDESWADDAEATGFLYPFLDAEERDQDSLLTDLAASARAKAAESAELRRRHAWRRARTWSRRPAAEMARRFAAGGRLFAFGNGGSSTDAATLAALFAHPPLNAPLPAWSLTADQAILTALGNDVGFELVFARQLIARAGARRHRGGAVHQRQLEGPDRRVPRRPKQRGMYTVGFAGYDGGQFAASTRRRRLLRPCGRRACTASRRRRPCSATSSGPPCTDRSGGPVTRRLP